MATYTYPLSASFGIAKSGQDAYYTIIDATGAIKVARTDAGVSEVSGSGVYEVDATVDSEWGLCRVRWDLDELPGVVAEAIVNFGPVPADVVSIEAVDATDALEALLANNSVVLDKYTRAQLYGLTEVTPAGGGNTLVTYMEDDGTTPAFDVTVSPASERIARNLY